MNRPIVPRQVADAICRQDIFSFYRAAFPIVSGGARLVPGWYLEALAYRLGQLARGEIRNLIITVPPRSGKSTFASVVLPAYVLGHDPTQRVLCASYSEALARKFALDCRALMGSAFYRRIFPGTRIGREKDTGTEFMTAARGYRLSASVGSTLTGRGGGLIILDDPLKAEDAHSEALREAVFEWYRRTLSTRLDNKAEDGILIVGQRLHTDDLIGRVLALGGDWVVLDLPAIAESEERIPLGHGRFHLRRPGELLQPEREPMSVLDELRRTMGSADFSAQYLQRPVPTGGIRIRLGWFPRHDRPPHWQPGDRIIVSWDTALSARELADYSACVVLQVRGESVYILDVIRERLEFPALREKVLQVHRRWSAYNDYALLIENRGSGMSLIQELKHLHVHAKKFEPIGEKVMRMEAQTARLEAGAVSLPQKAVWLEDFLEEILAFPASRHDDQIDALAQGLDYAFNARQIKMSWGPIMGLY